MLTNFSCSILPAPKEITTRAFFDFFIALFNTSGDDASAERNAHKAGVPSTRELQRLHTSRHTPSDLKRVGSESEWVSLSSRALDAARRIISARSSSGS